MSKIKINDDWQIDYDGAQYTPERWRGGYINERTNKPVKEGWVSCQKYFPSVSSCLRWLIDQDVLNKGDLTLTEFLVEYQASADELTEAVKKAIGKV